MTVSPRCDTLCPVALQQMPATWQIISYTTSGNSMAFPTTSSQIRDLNSLAISGNTSALASGYPHASQPHSSQKLMAKQTGQTRLWNNTCVPSSPINKMIGHIGFLWQSLQPTTNTPKQLRQLPSWPTPATILNVLST